MSSNWAPAARAMFPAPSSSGAVESSMPVSERTDCAPACSWTPMFSTLASIRSIAAFVSSSSR